VKIGGIENSGNLLRTPNWGGKNLVAKGWKYDDVFGACCFLSGVGRGYYEEIKFL